MLRAGRVKVDTGDLAGREANVITGAPIVTVWLAALRETSRRAELRLAVDKPGILYLIRVLTSFGATPVSDPGRAFLATVLERQELPHTWRSRGSGGR